MSSSEADDVQSVDESDLTSISESLVNDPEFEAIRQTYRETWYEFYSWEQEASLQDIRSLKRTKSTEDRQSLDSALFENEEVDLAQYMMPDYAPIDIDEEQVTFYDGESIQTITSVCKVFEAPAFEPFPVYESCTPAPYSLISRHHQAEKDKVLRFFPCDENGLIVDEELLKHFGDFLWMVDQHNSDRSYSSQTPAILF